jgi:hypothetical protein
MEEKIIQGSAGFATLEELKWTQPLMLRSAKTLDRKSRIRMTLKLNN